MSFINGTRNNSLFPMKKDYTFAKCAINAAGQSRELFAGKREHRYSANRKIMKIIGMQLSLSINSERAKKGILEMMLLCITKECARMF